MNKLLNSKKTEMDIISIEPRLVNCYVEDAFFILQDNYYRKLKYVDILWIESYYNYCDIHLTNRKKISVIQPLSKLEKIVPPNSFMRIHRSFIININAVDRFAGSMVYIGDNPLKVSRQYHSKTFSCFNVLERKRSIERAKK